MLLIDKEAYQQKLLEIMYSSVLDNMIDSSIYKNDNSAKNAIRYGICLASLFTCDGEIWQVKPTECGQWIYDHDLAGMRYYRCTKCADTNVETFAAEVEVKWWKYCPRCGAKMQIKNTEQEKEPIES